MKARLLIYFSLAFFMISFYGCKSACEIKNRAEGFNGEMLRVYVRINKSDIPGQYKNDSHNYMMMLGERRAALLLESYIIANSGDAEGGSPFTGKIPDVVKNSKMVCEECNDYYCGAFIDYDASAFREIIVK